jgi:putative redox protein
MALHPHARLTWQSGHRFIAHSGSGHEIAIDSPGRPGHLGPSPMELLLEAVAGCTAIDMVTILERMRQPLGHLEIEISGDRSDQNPKRYTAIHLTYRLRGDGLDPAKVERAVELSQSTYCGALATLRPDCKITTSIVIEPG